MEGKRIYLIDNIKAILILTVVFAHLLEPLLNNTSNKLIYLIIYSFHMSLFAFCSGYFAKFNPDKIKQNLIYPFILFQLLYILFDHYILGGNISIQFTTPYWIIWYLFALIIWKMTIPIIETNSNKKKGIILCIFFLLGLIVGFDNTIGYYMSLSRIIVFFPFFLTAYYWHKSFSDYRLLRILKSKITKIIIFLCMGIVIIHLIRNLHLYRIDWFYASKSYQKADYTIYHRVFLYFSSIIWIFFFLIFIPNRKLIFTRLGENSIYIYLLHGFIVLLIKKYNIYQYIPIVYQTIFLFLFTLLLSILLSSRFVCRLVSPLIKFPLRNESFDN